MAASLDGAAEKAGRVRAATGGTKWERMAAALVFVIFILFWLRLLVHLES